MLIKWLVYRRLPWAPAIEPRDCGASAFASIAGYYQHHLSLEQARALVGADRDGTTLAGLRDGGRAIGLEARPAEAIYAALAEVPLPAIVHLDGGEGHYLVLYRWTPRAVVVLDPSRGLRRLRRAEFEAVWSGYLVEFRPTPALRPQARALRPHRLLLGLAARHRGALLLALAAALLATALGWAAAFYLQALVDRILPDREAGLLAALGLGLVLVSGLQALLQLGRLTLSARVGREIHRAYGRRYIDHLLRLPMQVFDSRCVPGLAMRVTQAEGIQLAITESGVALAADGLLFLAALGIILVYDPPAAAIVAGAAPVILGMTLLLNDRVRGAQFTAMVRLEAFASQMVDAFEGLRTIKTFGAEARYRRLLDARLGELTAAQFDSRMAMALPTAWSWLATSLVAAGVLWYGGGRALAGQLTAGELLVLFGLVSFSLLPVQRLPATALTIRAALIALERLEEICALPPEEARTIDPRPLPSARGRIEFDRVSFAYKRRRPVLRAVSLTIEPGETVAIVGETGSGKTSLANLIAGFYLPDEGEVRIDEVSTRQLAPDELRRTISAVFQQARLMQQSVRDNITLMADAPLERVRRAARLAGADDFIGRLHRGYEGQVARNGDNFSSGQAQRIALARALLKDAPILILDEATSNLDGATEQAILGALAGNRRGRTTVVIAHRLSTILTADRIVVMDDGAIVEVGTHDELVRRRGRYYELVRWQLGEHAGAESALLVAVPGR